MISINNNHAVIYAASAVIDETNRQLVAVSPVIAHGSAEILKSLYGTLFSNHATYFRVECDDPRRTFFLEGAKRGYLKMNVSLMPKYIRGQQAILLHPDALQQGSEHFYVVAAHNQSIGDIFINALGNAIAWPVFDVWADWLLQRGREESLVDDLVVLGDEWKTGYVVKKSDAAWQQIISDGLKSAVLTIPEVNYG